MACQLKECRDSKFSPGQKITKESIRRNSVITWLIDIIFEKSKIRATSKAYRIISCSDGQN